MDRVAFYLISVSFSSGMYYSLKAIRIYIKEGEESWKKIVVWGAIANMSFIFAIFILLISRFSIPTTNH